MRGCIMVTIAWHELLSWLLTIISAVLFFYERKRNDGRKYYMVLQGMLRACSKHANFLLNRWGGVTNNPQREIAREEVLMLIDSEYTNTLALMEYVMGAMKAIEPKQDAPYDVSQFLQGNRMPMTDGRGQEHQGDAATRG